MNTSSFTILISILSLAISAATYVHTRSQFNLDYSATAIANIDISKIRTIEHNVVKDFDITVTNTSKSDLSFYLNVRADGVHVGEAGDIRTSPSVGYPLAYQSQVTTLSRIDAGKNSKVFSLGATHAQVMSGTILPDGMPTENFVPPIVNWLRFEVVNAVNGRIIYSIRCTYASRPHDGAGKLVLASIAMREEITTENSNSACIHSQH